MGPCWHLGNTLEWPSCLSLMWFIIDPHFAKRISSVSLVAATQYMWFVTLFTHGCITLQSLRFELASNFLPTPGNTNQNIN